MASRGAAAAAFRALRSTSRLFKRLESASSSSSSSPLLGRRFLDHNQCLPRESFIRSALSVHCPRSMATSSSASAPTPAASRLFSADAAAAVSPSKVVVVKDDAHYAEFMKDVQAGRTRQVGREMGRGLCRYRGHEFSSYGCKDTLAVVYFTAQWCVPCKQLAPYIDQLSQQFDDVTFLKMDVDKLEVEQTVGNSQVGVVPTFHFYKKGKLIGELTAAAKDKLKSLVESLRSKS